MSEPAGADLIEIYLQDHHAGSTAGVALARRAAGSNRGGPYGAELEAIAAEIEADQEALESLMSAVGVGAARLKVWGAAAGERVGRLKRNGTWFSYSPLSRLVEIEGLIMAVSGKRSLWRAIDEAGIDPPPGVEYETLVARAEGQRDRLEALRSRAARDALRAPRP